MSIGCAVANMPTWMATALVDTNFVAERMDIAVYAAAQALTQRFCPSPLALTPDWWVETCSDLDITSVRLSLVMHLVQYSKLFDQRQLQSASWLGPALPLCVHICKMNASAGLSARSTMAFFPVSHALRTVETSARVELHAVSLLESGVVEALDYACLHDFTYIGSSVAGDGAGARHEPEAVKTRG